MNAPNNHSAFIRELLGDAYVDQRPPERFEARGFIDGIKIYERGEVICTFHGPQLALAGKVLRLLKDESARNQPGYGECALASASVEPSAAVLS